MFRVLGAYNFASLLNSNPDFSLQALERYYALLVKDSFEMEQGNLSMPIKAPCQPGQGPEIEINPEIFLESSCLEFVEGHEQMEEYLIQMAKEGAYVHFTKSNNQFQILSQKHLAFARFYFRSTVCWNARATKIVDYLLLFQSITKQLYIFSWSATL